MNDPNGLIQWQGVYHMFYQYNPNGAFWGTMHWGHAASKDLVHWTHLPIALAPTPGGPDADGCFSGCTVNNAGTPTLIYTGVHGALQLPCIATSDDDLLTWHKHPGNPVIPAPPQHLDMVGFRDHSAWREGGVWYQIIGSGIRGMGGTALLYRSPNLIDWEYVQPIYTGDAARTGPLWTGTMWECPDLFALDGKHVLIVSVWDNQRTHYPVYFTGSFANHTLEPETEHLVDLGDSFYAPQTLLDDRGRRIMLGWLREANSADAQLASGWSGVMSLPRILSIRPDGLLGMEPAPELEMLRGEHRHWADIDLSASAAHVLDDARGDTLEIFAELDLGDATEVGLKVRCSPDRMEETRIVYDRAGQRLLIDRERSSLSGDVCHDATAGLFELARGEPLRLRIFLDRSVVEVFANERVCHTARIYPSRADSLGVDLFAHGGGGRINRLDIWKMLPI